MRFLDTVQPISGFEMNRDLRGMELVFPYPLGLAACLNYSDNMLLSRRLT